MIDRKPFHFTNKHGEEISFDHIPVALIHYIRDLEYEKATGQIEIQRLAAVETKYFDLQNEIADGLEVVNKYADMFRKLAAWLQGLVEDE